MKITINWKLERLKHRSPHVAKKNKSQKSAREGKTIFQWKAEIEKRYRTRNIKKAFEPHFVAESSDYMWNIVESWEAKEPTRGKNGIMNKHERLMEFPDCLPFSWWSNFAVIGYRVINIDIANFKLMMSFALF